MLQTAPLIGIHEQYLLPISEYKVSSGSEYARNVDIGLNHLSVRTINCRSQLINCIRESRKKI